MRRFSLHIRCATALTGPDVGVGDPSNAKDNHLVLFSKKICYISATHSNRLHTGRSDTNNKQYFFVCQSYSMT